MEYISKDSNTVKNYDNHLVIDHDEHQTVSCSIKNETYEVKSNMGDLNIFCPGCGKKLDHSK